jgi:hypothetical protein
VIGDEPLYMDSHHLAPDGARLLEPLFQHALANASLQVE